jgi:hypothetical protein
VVEEEGNILHEGVHRYVKAVYFDAWDSRATADDPYIIAVTSTGDLARVSFSGKAVTMCGAKQCARRLVSQQRDDCCSDCSDSSSDIHQNAASIVVSQMRHWLNKST